VVVSREVNQAKKQSRELVTQLSSIESQLAPRSRSAGQVSPALARASAS
jgi:hypothetical protein